MGLRNHLTRLKKVADAVGHEEVQEFFRCLQDHGNTPRCILHWMIYYAS